MGKGHIFDKTVLPNGIRVLSEKVPGSRAVSIGVWVTAGSRDEPWELSGISHFIEHMIFKGTANRSALEIAKTFDRLGGFSNAFTSKETTCFHAKVLDSHLDIIMELLSDIFLNSVFDPLEVDRERQVILQEISMMEDSPDELVHELFNVNFWKGNPVERSILGSPDTVSLISSDSLKTHIREYYTGKKVLISASGNIDHDDLCSRAQGLFSCLGDGNHLPARTAPEPNFDIFFKKKDLEQTHVLLGLPGPSSSDPGRYRTVLMNVILGGSMSSRLFQEVREKRGLAYAVYSFVSSLNDSGLLGIYAGVAPENTGEAVSIIRKEMEKMATDTVDEAEIQAAKDNIKGGLLLSSENTDSRMSRIARNEIDLGQYISYEEVVENIESVTAEEIRNCAADLLHDGVAAAIVGPSGNGEIEKCRKILAGH